MQWELTTAKNQLTTISGDIYETWLLPQQEWRGVLDHSFQAYFPSWFWHWPDPRPCLKCTFHLMIPSFSEYKLSLHMASHLVFLGHPAEVQKKPRQIHRLVETSSPRDPAWVPAMTILIALRNWKQQTHINQQTPNMAADQAHAIRTLCSFWFAICTIASPFHQGVRLDWIIIRALAFADTACLGLGCHGPEYKVRWLNPWSSWAKKRIMKHKHICKHLD